MSGEAIIGLVGVALGFALAEGSAFLNRCRTHNALWQSLGVEVEFIKGRVDRFVEDRVQSPLYRLPQECFRTALPRLLEVGSLNSADTNALMTFYSEVDTFNRGLEQAAAATGDEREKEFERLATKKVHGVLEAYKAARLAINPKVGGGLCSNSWGRFSRGRRGAAGAR